MATIGAVINPGSGTLSPAAAEERLQEVERCLAPRVTSGLLAIVPGDQVEDEIARLVALKVAILVIGGGDGTVSTAARYAAESNIALAVVGLGTRNHFARDAGVPLEPFKAIELLDRLKEKRIDLAEVNGRVFINNASIGLYPKVVRKRKQRMVRHGWRKWFAAMTAAATVVRRAPQMNVEFEANGRRFQRRTPLLFVGNNEYEGGMLENSNRRTLSSGCLWVCTARASGFLSLLGIAWKGTLGKVQNVGELDTLKTSEMTVHFRQPRITVAIDGENCILATPLRFRIRPRSLRLLVS